MTKVEKIEQQIEERSAPEFAEIREWILQRDWARWDTHIEGDVSAGQHYRALRHDIVDGNQWFWIGTHAEYDKLIG